MKKYSLDAKDLLSKAEMFEIKAGEKQNATDKHSCDMCTTCVGCSSSCTMCTTKAFDVIVIP